MSGFGLTTLLTKGLLGSYTASLIQSEPTIARELSMVVPSTAKTETHAGLDQVPQLVAWAKEGRKITAIGEKSYTLTNVRYQSAIAIDRDYFEDDQLRNYMMRASQLGQRAGHHPTALTVAAIEAGATAGNTSYDGVTFFNDTHPIRGDMSATWDNSLAGAGTSVANLQTDLQAVKSALRRFRDEANEPVNENMSRLLIVAPPELEHNFLTALNAQLISNTSNVTTRGMAELFITSRLTDVDNWYVFNLGQAIKPLVWQQRKNLTPESVTSGSEVFRTGNYFWGIYGRYAVGYLMPLFAIRVVN